MTNQPNDFIDKLNNVMTSVSLVKKDIESLSKTYDKLDDMLSNLNEIYTTLALTEHKISDIQSGLSDVRAELRSIKSDYTEFKYKIDRSIEKIVDEKIVNHKKSMVDWLNWRFMALYLSLAMLAGNVPIGAILNVVGKGTPTP